MGSSPIMKFNDRILGQCLQTEASKYYKILHVEKGSNSCECSWRRAQITSAWGLSQPISQQWDMASFILFVLPHNLWSLKIACKFTKPLRRLIYMQSRHEPPELLPVSPCNNIPIISSWLDQNNKNQTVALTLPSSTSTFLTAPEEAMKIIEWNFSVAQWMA